MRWAGGVPSRIILHSVKNTDTNTLLPIKKACFCRAIFITYNFIIAVIRLQFSLACPLHFILTEAENMLCVF
ncbi:MAG: hypothetical protein BWK80_20635 [Desulfobacteraceae bacterium IS3]|nr:MAG: hypothetical protein BWK80_20635 [Desulfobacteraceae bacterium IS3]